MNYGRRGPKLISAAAGCQAAVIFLGAILSSGPAAPVHAETVPRSVCIGAVSGSPGAPVTVPLTIDDGDGVAAFQVDVGFDPSLVAPAGARLGPDTPASAGWVIDSEPAGAGRVRVLAYSFPPTPLDPGLRRVALIDFFVQSSAPLVALPSPLSGCVLGDVNGTAIACAICAQPGVDGAAARFAISLVDDGFAFRPARLVVEPGDWALWRHVGSFRFHTATSGAGCVADGLWRGELQPGGEFARRFAEAPVRTLPYFSEPDCLAGMTGEVVVAGGIVLDLEAFAGGARLSWAGGSGLYAVVRADTPTFAGLPTTTFVPDGGDAGLTLIDPEPSAAGRAHFYLVTNK